MVADATAAWTRWGRWGCTLPPMSDDDTWITIVVRAWAEAGGIRIRLLRADGSGARDDQVVASVDQAAATLTRWLRPATTGQRRPEGRGADAAGDAADAEG
jgi:hypothetical protein